MIQFEIHDEYIEFFRLLKAIKAVDTGGHAKLFIDDGEVLLNGQVEYRKRAKVRKGDQVDFQNFSIKVC